MRELLCPPAKRFVPALAVRNAKFLPTKPAFIHRGRARGRFLAGIKYEREVQEHLALFALGRPELVHLAGPWLEFTDASGKRYCQPDALFINRDARSCTIFEVKYQHTSDAWWQLKRLYEPVLRVALPGFSFSCVEIVHWFDPATVWPEERVANVPGIPAIQHPSELVQVIIFNKRRERRFHPAGDSERKGADQEAGPLWPAKGTK